MRYIFSVLLLCFLLLAGCGTTGPSGALGGADKPTEPPTAEKETSQTTPEARRLPIVERAETELAGHLGVSVEQLQVVKVEDFQWSDSSLGCPAPDKMYLEVITPGYKIEIRANGTIYTLHTDQEGNNIILCPAGRPTPLSAQANEQLSQSDKPTAVPTEPVQPTSEPPEPPTPEPEQAEQPKPTPTADSPAEEAMSQPDRLIAIAKDMLTQELGVPAGDIAVHSVEEVNWPSSGLGCEKPGRMYLTVITPGYRIVLEHNGQRYTYHTDQGKQVIRCDKGLPPNLADR